MTFDEAMILTSGISSSTAFSDAECRCLWDLLQSVRRSGTVVEIGCQLGRTSSLILQASKSIGFHPIFIDPWTVQPDFMRQWMLMAHSISTPFTVHMMRTDQSYDNFSHNSLDLLLIDGDHTAAGVKADLPMASNLVYPAGGMDAGGILCAHDYGRPSLPDVKEVIDQFMLESPDYQPVTIADTLAVWRVR